MSQSILTHDGQRGKRGKKCGRSWRTRKTKFLYSERRAQLAASRRSGGLHGKGPPCPRRPLSPGNGGDLYSLWMTRGENCYNKVRSPGSAKKEILIFPDRRCIHNVWVIPHNIRHSSLYMLPYLISNWIRTRSSALKGRGFAHRFHH